MRLLFEVSHWRLETVPRVMHSIAPYRCTSTNRISINHLVPQPHRLQILRRPRRHSSRISIDRLEHLPQPPVAVILLIPLVFVVNNPLARPLPILLRRFLKTQSDEVIDVERLGRQPWGPGSLHLEDNRGWSVGLGRGLRRRDDFEGFGRAAFHYNRNAPPLAACLEPCVAVWMD
jgi:hypothetical protein